MLILSEPMVQIRTQSFTSVSAISWDIDSHKLPLIFKSILLMMNDDPHNLGRPQLSDYTTRVPTTMQICGRVTHNCGRVLAGNRLRRLEAIRTRITAPDVD